MFRNPWNLDRFPEMQNDHVAFGRARCSDPLRLPQPRPSFGWELSEGAGHVGQQQREQSARPECGFHTVNVSTWSLATRKGAASPQILKKIFRRYIQNKMSQKIVITAKP